MTLLFTIAAIILFSFQQREAAALIATLAIAVALIEAANMIRRSFALPFALGARKKRDP